MTDEQLILAYLAEHPGSATSEIERQVNLSRRTLQRRLKDLITAGRIRQEGRSRGTRYFLSHANSSIRPNPDAEIATAARIQSLLARPVSERTPVPYKIEFLRDYEPNQTWYLDSTAREHLWRIGGVSGTNMPAGTYARQILDRLLIDLSWNSSRLEGNTYSLLETEQLLNDGVPADDRDAFETQMIINHKAAIEFLVEGAADIGFNSLTLRNLHGLLSENLLSDPAASGRLRAFPVGITGFVFYPLNNPHQINEFFLLLLNKADAIRDPFEQALFVLVQLPYLQPFSDVNKRVSRLAANLPLIQRNLSPLSFIDVATHDYLEATLAIYELNNITLLRDLFMAAYERSVARYTAIRESLGEPDRFRMEWRAEIKNIVTEIITKQLSRSDATESLRAFSLNLPDEARERFIDTVAVELDSIHEGNFARYRVRPTEFEKWYRNWTQ